MFRHILFEVKAYRRAESRLGLILILFGNALLRNASLLTGETAQVVELSATHLTSLDAGNHLDVGAFEGEDTLYTHCATHLADGEALLVAVAADLDNDTAVLLDTLLVALDNLVIYCNCVARTEAVELADVASSKCFLSNFN